MGKKAQKSEKNKEAQQASQLEKKGGRRGRKELFPIAKGSNLNLKDKSQCAIDKLGLKQSCGLCKGAKEGESQSRKLQQTFC